MKRLYKLLSVLTFALLLSGCETNNQEELVEILPEDLITMEILDDYMYRDDVQYVDLRNFDAKFQSGYIDNFEVIPFFDYLDYRVFDREDGYEFTPDQLLDARELERLFDPEKAIFLYADGCIRSGYLKDALNYLGYERVYVIGGFFEYEGQYKIDGIGNYSYGNTFYFTYEDQSSGDLYSMSGTFDMGKKITSIRFDIIDSNGITKRGTGYSDNIDYNTHLTLLENHIIGDTLTLNELYDSLTDETSPMMENIANFDESYFDKIVLLVNESYVK